MFKTTEYYFDVLRVGVLYTIEFPYEGDVYVRNIETPCDCTDVANEISNHRVVVKYTPKEVPQHLRAEGKSSYIADKIVNIYYQETLDGPEKAVSLRIKATILP